MSVIEKPVPGSFSWIELGTTDQSAAKTFYSGLFNWTADDHPMGPGDFYTMFLRNGHTAAAAYTLRSEQQSNHVPPHWMIYIAVESADDVAKRAEQLGGKVLAPPFDVYDFGRMAVLQDPAGATFSLWQAKSHIGVSVKDEAGSICWADLNTPNQQAAADFYSKLFGWTVEPGQDASGYLHIKNGEAYIGGIPAPQQQAPNAPPHWLAYFQVSDCDATTDKAKKSGARIFFGPTTLENVGRFTVLADPQGAVFSLFQPK